MEQEFVEKDQMVMNLLKLKADLVGQYAAHNLSVNTKEVLDAITKCLHSKYKGLRDGS